MSEAAKWFLKAAEQGHPRAQLKIGLMYDKGEGVKQDPVEAAKWYRRAASQGYAPAQFNLGFAYDTGDSLAAPRGRCCRRGTSAR